MNPVPQTATVMSSPEGSTAVLELEDVVKERRQGGSGFELQIPAFSLVPGEFVAVVGESGCGKSTLLDLLALVLRPTRCVRFVLRELGARVDDAGADVAALWEGDFERELARLRRQHLGYVLQTGGLLPFLSVRQNVLLPMRFNGLGSREERLRAMARRIGVDALLDKKPQYLSGGQRQRAAILRALAHRPAIVLADEPTAAVDKTRARRIVADFSALAREEGCVIVMVTHDHALIENVADRTFSFSVSQVADDLTRSVCREQPA